MPRLPYSLLHLCHKPWLDNLPQFPIFLAEGSSSSAAALWRLCITLSRSMDLAAEATQLEVAEMAFMKAGGAKPGSEARHYLFHDNLFFYLSVPSSCAKPIKNSWFSIALWVYLRVQYPPVLMAYNPYLWVIGTYINHLFGEFSGDHHLLHLLHVLYLSTNLVIFH